MPPSARCKSKINLAEIARRVHVSFVAARSWQIIAYYDFRDIWADVYSNYYLDKRRRKAAVYRTALVTTTREESRTKATGRATHFGRVSTMEFVYCVLTVRKEACPAAAGPRGRLFLNRRKNLGGGGCGRCTVAVNLYYNFDTAARKGEIENRTYAYLSFRPTLASTPSLRAYNKEGQQCSTVLSCTRRGDGGHCTRRRKSAKSRDKMVQCNHDHITFAFFAWDICRELPKI